MPQREQRFHPIAGPPAARQTQSPAVVHYLLPASLRFEVLCPTQLCQCFLVLLRSQLGDSKRQCLVLTPNLWGQLLVQEGMGLETCLSSGPCLRTAGVRTSGRRRQACLHQLCKECCRCVLADPAALSPPGSKDLHMCMKLLAASICGE